MKSRPFGARGQGPAPSRPRPAERAPERSGVGGSGTAYTGPHPGRPDPAPHHSRPLQGLPGPLRWVLLGSSSGSWVLGGWVLHPVYPPGYPPCIPTSTGTPTTRMSWLVHTTHGPGTPRTCTYGRFWTAVGEPRGVEHSRVLGSRTGLYCI